MEQSQIGTTVKIEMEEAATTTVYSASEIELNHLEQEPGLVQSVFHQHCGPAMLVKQEIVENGSGDDSEQQCADLALTPTGSDSLYEANGKSQGQWIDVKSELEEMDIGPTVLQHMDIHYALIKTTVNGCNDAMRHRRVKEEVEDKLRDSLTPQKAMTKERILVIRRHQYIVHEHHLASVCSVHVMRLNVFQCDLYHALYTEKDKLLQHLQAMQGCRPQTSLIVKLRKTNKGIAADNKAALNNYEAPMKSHQGQQKDLQNQRLTRSKGYKCQRTFRKRHLLSDHNNLHQRSSREAVKARGPVASSSDQSGGKRTKIKQKPFECEVCKKGYSSNAVLNLHKRSHSSVNLKKHCRSDTRKKHHHYDAKLAKNGDLTKTNGVQRDDKTIQCKLCDSRFVSNYYLTIHMRVHTGEKPYQCTICDARFAQSGGLTRHGREALSV